MSWRDELVPASFRGVVFHVEIGSKSGGKRLVLHEFPKSDNGFVENMGQRLKRFTVMGYVLGDDFISLRNSLVQALDEPTPGFLSLPTGFSGMVQCESYNTNERREVGGLAEVEMSFFESGQSPSFFSTDTKSGIDAASIAALKPILGLF